jgi:hypothetical protein
MLVEQPFWAPNDIGAQEAAWVVTGRQRRSSWRIEFAADSLDRKARDRNGVHDAVVQGLSAVPCMEQICNWAILSIGTGLDNTHFLARKTPGDETALRHHADP